jgi:hypothetical protein
VTNKFSINKKIERTRIIFTRSTIAPDIFPDFNHTTDLITFASVGTFAMRGKFFEKCSSHKVANLPTTM